MFFAFFTLWILAIVWAIKRKAHKSILNPIMWLILAWSFLIGTYLTSGITYQNGITPLGALYMASFFIVFGFVYYSYIRRNGKREQYDNHAKDRINYPVKRMFKIGVFGLALYLFDFVRLNSLSNLYALHEGFSMTIIGGTGLVLLCANTFVWIYNVIDCITNDTKIPLYTYIAAASQIVPYYLISGRQGMIIIFIEGVMTFAYSFSKNRSYKYKKGIYGIIGIVVVAIGFYFVDISAQRTNVYELSSQIYVIEMVGKTSISDEARNMIMHNKGIGSAVLTMLYYFSHQFRSFQVFIDYYNHWPLLGAYEFHYIARRLPAFLDLTGEAYVALENMAKASGLSYHVYRTAIAAFIMDFGWVGSYIFTAVIAWFTAKRYVAFQRNSSTFNAVFQIIICTGFVFSIEYSPFSEQLWAYSWFWMLFLPKFSKIKFKIRR